MKKQIKKIIPYLLLLLLLTGVGFFNGAGGVRAAEEPNGVCTIISDLVGVNGTFVTTTYTICTAADKTQLAKLINNDVSVIKNTKWSELSGTPGFCYVTGTRESGWLNSFWKATRYGETTVRQFGAEFPNILEGDCSYPGLSKIPNSGVEPGDNYSWSQKPLRAGQEATAANEELSAFEEYLQANQCGIFGLGGGTFWPGCFLQLTYGVFYALPSFLLFVCAYFFNSLIYITLSSELFADSAFIKTAWGVVRDLSNLFFILILLYIAIKIILDMGASDAKKMISKVIIVALLINFSMFFTGIVIDTSNILALVFYNKLQVDTKDADETPREYQSASGERDVAGGMVTAFDATRLLTPEFFGQAKGITVDQTITQGQSPTQLAASPSIVIGVTIIAGLIMFFAAYVFFVAGFAFIGRLVELWILIIASPFAFMSSIVPEMAGIKDWGWKAWLHRLLTASFMASAFMFFLYFIFLILEKGNPLQESIVGEGFINSILHIVLPGLLILILLLKSLKLAKSAAGQLGEAVMKYGEKAAGMAGGLALGAATGGTALAARGIIGGGGGWLAQKAASRTYKLGDKFEKKFGYRLGTDKIASGLTGAAALAQKSSFDLRAGGVLAKATGLNLGEAQKGGIEQSRKDKVKKRMERAEIFGVREDEGLKQKLNKSEIDLQVMLNKVARDFGNIDRELESLRKAKADAATGSDEEKDIANKIEALNQAKKDVREGRDTVYTLDGGTTWKNISGVKVEGGDNNGKTMKKMASEVIPEQKEDVEAETRRRRVAFANRKGNWGIFSSTANKEARHKIIMGEKLPESAAKA